MSITTEITALRAAGTTISTALSSLRGGGTAAELVGALGRMDDGLGAILSMGRSAQRHIGPAVNLAQEAQGGVRQLSTALERGATRIDPGVAGRIQSPTARLLARIDSLRLPDAASGVAHIAWPS
jgi:hypothetical protein